MAPRKILKIHLKKKKKIEFLPSRRSSKYNKSVHGQTLRAEKNPNTISRTITYLPSENISTIHFTSRPVSITESPWLFGFKGKRGNESLKFPLPGRKVNGARFLPRRGIQRLELLPPPVRGFRVVFHSPVHGRLPINENRERIETGRPNPSEQMLGTCCVCARVFAVSSDLQTRVCVCVDYV